MTQDSLRSRLSDLAEPVYYTFLEKLKASDRTIFGVRSKHIHTIAKELSKNEGKEAFLSILYYPSLGYEEILILYRLFGLLDFSTQERLAYLDSLLSYNHSWATNDTLASALSCICDEKEAYYSYFSSLLCRKEPYEVRLGIVTLMLYYLDPPHITEVLQCLKRVPSEHYYVMMGLGWAFATAYCKNPSLVYPYLEKQTGLLDERVRKKAIQKIIESNMVDETEKIRIKALR